MAKHSTAPLIPFQKRWSLMILLCIVLSSTIAFFVGTSFNSCNSRDYPDNNFNTAIYSFNSVGTAAEREENPLSFMKSKLVLMVSHELSLSGGPLLLMDLAFLLRAVSTWVVWITNQKPAESDEVIFSLEQRMMDIGVEVLPAKGQEAVDTSLKVDLVILNTTVADKWLDTVLQKNLPRVLPKVLWWIHEMRGHYFKLEIKMPQTHVVHLGNSKELMEVAEDIVARRVLREHIKESLGLQKDDLLFAIINSVSQGKGQDLFLMAFYEALQLSQERKLKLPPMYAVIVGSDMAAQTKFETELRNFVSDKKIQDRVHFVNKTLNVSPYLASIDVLVQNSQARGECFGRITIEAMGFQLPVLGTAAGGTLEIVVNGTTGWLHLAGKESVTPLSENIVQLAANVEMRRTMGRNSYARVKEMFLERHMSHRISLVLKEVLQNTKRAVH